MRRAAFLAPLAALAASTPPALCQTTGGSQSAADAVTLTGRGQQTATLNGVPIQLFTYRPGGCAISSILLVFHGMSRDAGPYRDHATPLGQRFCMLVVAPYFDAARFPAWRYQRGGIVRHGGVQPEADWTVDFVPAIAAWARKEEGRPNLPYVLIGHSGGAQFLSRVAAFGRSGALRIIIANPSTWVEPTLNVMAPYGFGGVYEPAEGEAALRRYLAAPIVILLGRKDTGSHELAMSEQAQKQGANRLDRGRKTFRKAELVAREHGWAFNWRLAVVPGVGHSASGMFTSKAAFDALQR
ncbi:MAG: alpha/beta hydrolase [Acetobacteraceae bacterium]